MELEVAIAKAPGATDLAENGAGGHVGSAGLLAPPMTPMSHSSHGRGGPGGLHKRQQPNDGSKLLRNDQVYRQLFESQVQLADQLASVRWQRENRPQVKAAKSTRDLSLPVVRNAVGHGMLNSSQAGWTRALENDAHTQNPVLVRQQAEWLDLVCAQSDAQRHAGEVADLPDVVRPSKLKSDVIDRIKEKRRERHNLTLEEMHQELNQVGVAYEPRIVERCRQLQEALAVQDEALERLLAPIADNDGLRRMSLQELDQLWEKLAEIFEARRLEIDELDAQLQTLEEERVEDLRQIFRSYSELMERVSHLAPAELHRIIDDEAMQVNQTLLGNQRNLADLHARLLMSELQRERRTRSSWQEKIVEWRRVHSEAGVAAFAEFMSGDEVQNPTSLAEIYREMREELSAINAERLLLIEEVKNFVPPNASKSMVAKWHQRMQQVCKRLDQANQHHMRRVYEDYELVCQRCLEAMQNLQSELVQLGVATPEQADQLAKDRCLPLISAQQRRFEQKLEVMDRLFEVTGKRVNLQLKSLYKLAQGASHLWDRHELELASLERGLAEKLEENREEHNRQNQEKEAQLDVVMDKLRQESSENGLKFQLGRALEMLKTIEGTYHKFHSEQQHAVREYPRLVDQEVDALEKNVCEYFGVERATKKKVEKKRTRPGLKPAELAKIKAAQEAQQPEADEWIKAAFREILFTSKGSEFRVLIEAGVHGVPPTDGEPRHGFISLLPADESDKAAEEDENVRSALISRRVILEAKVEIRQNFLDFVDSWRPDAMKRSSGVVQAKLEELEAELRLRLHLHEPRARRAELDVHNVRAAELVLHKERVERHLKGVIQTLDQMKAEFAAMNEEHDRLMAAFISTIDGMEDSYTTATKSAKLVTLSSQCATEVDGFMASIRTSLRKFRQGLDEKLQMLREANARFIKSFKLFSEGGNFCPEEVDLFRKKLDTMTSKVDNAESSILSELEGMEKKRLDSANAKVKEFEEQFRNHMIDLVFMEKVARWLTNTQVKIKAEVSDSNSQALKLLETLDTLDRRVDACARPNLDKETVHPEDLHSSLHAIFDMFNDRSVYLNCIGTQKPPPVVVTVDDSTGGADAAGGAAADAKLVRLPATQPAPVSRPGKQPTEDPSVGVIKRILKTQRARAHGAEVVIDADKEEAAAARDKRMKKKPAAKEAAQEAAQDNLTPAAPVSDNTRTPSLQGHGQASVTKMDSVARNSRRGSHVGELGGHTVGRRTSASRKFVAKNQRLDKKYLVFGEAEEQSEAFHFLGRVKRICREALDGTLLAAETYYRQKGSRAVTRPQSLHETFDQCAEAIISKLQAYYGQADVYHNSCVIELRDQLERLERLVEQIPLLTFKDLFEATVASLRASLQQMDKEATRPLAELESRRRQHEETLSPALGHPERLHLLTEVCQEEERRHDELTSMLSSLKADKQDIVLKAADKFSLEVSQLAEMLFIKLDSLLTVDDVERGRQPPDLESTAALLRKQIAGEPLQDPSKEQLIPRGKANWPGLPLNEFQLAELAPKSLRRATLIVTAKTTMAHNQTDQARRRFYDAFKEFFNETMEQIRMEIRERETLEARWHENWQKSVQRIKDLY